MTPDSFTKTPDTTAQSRCVGFVRFFGSDFFIPSTLFLLFVLCSFKFLIDDTFITFLVSKNLIENGIYSTTPDVLISPTTAFLHSLIGAFFYFIGGADSTEWGVKSLGLFLGIASIGAVVSCLRHLGASYWVRLFCGTFVAGSFPLIVWTASAMETTYVAAALTCFACLLLIPRLSSSSVVPALVALLCVLLRMDSGVVVAALLTAAVYSARFSLRSIVNVGALFILPVIICLWLHHHFFGNVFPTPVMKASLTLDKLKDNVLGAGGHYFLDFARLNFHWLGIASSIGVFVTLLPAFMSGKAKRHQAVLFCTAGGVLAYMLYIVSQGSVHMMFTFRFYTPLIPLMGMVTGAALQMLLTRITLSPRTAANIAAACCLTLVVVDVRTFIHGYSVDMYFSDLRDQGFGPSGNDNIRGWALLHQEMKDAGRFFSEVLPPRARVGLWVAGIIPFFLKQQAYDQALIGSPPDGRVDYVLAQCSSNGLPPSDIVRYPRDRPSPATLFYPFTSFCLYPLGNKELRVPFANYDESASPNPEEFDNVYNYAMAWETGSLKTDQDKLAFLDAHLHGSPNELEKYGSFIDTLFKTLPPEQFASVPLTAYPHFSTRPTSVRSGLTGLRSHAGKKVLMVHVPSEVVFTLDSSVSEASLSFGVLSSAYENGGKMRQADMKLTVSSDAGEQVLFSTTLNPVDEPADRSDHHTHVTLPPAHKLTITFSPGPSSPLKYPRLSACAHEVGWNAAGGSGSDL